MFYYNSLELGLLQFTTTYYYNLRQLGYYNLRRLLLQFTTEQSSWEAEFFLHYALLARLSEMC